MLTTDLVCLLTSSVITHNPTSKDLLVVRAEDVEGGDRIKDQPPISGTNCLFDYF